MKMKVYQKIANLLDWKPNERFIASKEEQLDRIMEMAPSGSGVDSGTELCDKSSPQRLVFTFGYHHMHQHGYYNGWTFHKLIVKPCLIHGMSLRLTGRNRGDVKDYLYDVFNAWLQTEVK